MKEVKNDDMIFKDKAKQANVGQWQDHDLETGFPLTITFLVVFRNLGGLTGAEGSLLSVLSDLRFAVATVFNGDTASGKAIVNRAHAFFGRDYKPSIMHKKGYEGTWHQQRLTCRSVGRRGGGRIRRDLLNLL